MSLFLRDDVAVGDVARRVLRGYLQAPCARRRGGPLECAGLVDLDRLVGYEDPGALVDSALEGYVHFARLPRVGHFLGRDAQFRGGAVHLERPGGGLLARYSTAQLDDRLVVAVSERNGRGDGVLRDLHVHGHVLAIDLERDVLRLERVLDRSLDLHVRGVDIGAVRWSEPADGRRQDEDEQDDEYQCHKRDSAADDELIRLQPAAPSALRPGLLGETRPRGARLHIGRTAYGLPDPGAFTACASTLSRAPALLQLAVRHPGTAAAHRGASSPPV
jgi:hypothetical protein